MRRVILVTVLMFAVFPASALGATRYASPGGVAVGSCGQPEACSLAYAITAATGGDEVVVGPGTYPVATAIEAAVPLTVRGAAGQARPRIVGAREVTPLKSGEPLTLSNLTIESTESGEGSLFAYADGDVFDHLELIATGKDALALRPGLHWTLTDSLLVARGEAAFGLFLQGVGAGLATMRNDTVIGEGDKTVGVSIYATAPALVQIQATNVIVDAAIAAEAGGTSGSSTSIAFDHSDVQGTTSGAVTSTAAQTAPPKFVDPAAGNYREASGSPTIDAGVNDPANGSTDLDGNTRLLPGSISCTAPDPPATTDMGAYEFVPVAPPCTPPPPPPLPDTKLVKAKIHGRGASFRFVAVLAAPVRFECRLDSKPWRTCTSPRTYKHLRPGRHAFRVRAVGAAGPDPTPALRKFKVLRPHRHPRRGGVRNPRVG
jgi:hypothetical protein